MQDLRLTQVILQLLRAPILGRGDQVPHEALDFVVSPVMDQTVRQQRPADGLHVPLRQLLLKAPVFEDILPPAPPGQMKGKSCQALQEDSTIVEL